VCSATNRGIKVGIEERLTRDIVGMPADAPTVRSARIG
jgi:hypothetical protein